MRAANSGKPIGFRYNPRILADQAPWFVVGPVVGLVLVALYALLGVRMGVVGGISDIVDRATGRRAALGWKGWFVLGIVAGAALFAVASGGVVANGYGWMSRAGLSDAAIAALLVGAGVMIGAGAKHAGGCTSGNGISGVSFGSAASMAAMGTFFVTAVAGTAMIGALT